MKKLILLFIIFFTVSLNAQSFDLLLYGSDDGYDAEAEAYFNVVGTFADARKGTLDSLVLFVKDSLSLTNLSDQFDRFWVLAAHDSVAAFTSVVYPSSNVITGNGVTITADQGVQGDIYAIFLNTHFNPSTDKVVYAQNDASVGIYSRTNSATNKVDIGAYVTGYQLAIESRWTTDTFYGQVNGPSGDGVAGITDSRGLFTVIRTGSASTTYYQNAGSIGSGVKTSSAPVNADVYIGASNYNGSAQYFSGREYAFAFIGKGMTTTEMGKLFNCIEWYLDQLGAGVVP